jgi:phosphate:Na+ symporter
MTYERKLSFTPEAIKELEELQTMVISMLDTTIHVLRHRDYSPMAQIAALEDTIDEMSKNLQQNHLKRLDAGVCNVESGVVYIDVVNHFERIADHIYKISLMARDELQGLERTHVQVTKVFAS